MADPESPDSSESLNSPASPGAPAGDFAAGDDELLIDGQEEVFSRVEVESGRIEHLSQAGSSDDRSAEVADGGPTSEAASSP